MDNKKTKLVRQDSVHSDTGSSNSVVGITETCAEVHITNCDNKTVRLAKENSETQSYKSVTDPNSAENKSEFRSFEEIDSFDDIETYNDITNENLLIKQFSDTSYRSIDGRNISVANSKSKQSDNNGNTHAKLPAQQSSASYNSVIDDIGPKQTNIANLQNNLNEEISAQLNKINFITLIDSGETSLATHDSTNDKPKLAEFEHEIIHNPTNTANKDNAVKLVTQPYDPYSAANRKKINFNNDNHIDAQLSETNYRSIEENQNYDAHSTANTNSRPKLVSQLSETSYNSIFGDHDEAIYNKSNTQLNNASFESVIDITSQNEENKKLDAQSTESVYYSLNSNTDNIKLEAQSSESIFYSFDGNTDEPYIVVNYRNKTHNNDSTYRLSAQSTNSIYYSFDGNINDIRNSATNVYDLKSVTELNESNIDLNSNDNLNYLMQVGNNETKNGLSSSVKYAPQISQTSYHSIVIDPTELDSFHSNSSNESFHSAELQKVEVDTIISKIQITWYTNYLILFTMIFYTLDVGSDWILIVRYAAEGEWLFFMLTFLFVTVPSSFITYLAHQVLNRNLKMPILVACVFNLSPLMLYWKMINAVSRYWAASGLKYKHKEFQYFLKRSDEAATFRLLECNYEAIPQFVLQMVIILRAYPIQMNITTGLQIFSVFTSSFGTLMTNYSAYRSSYPPKGKYVSPIGGFIYTVAAGLPLVCRSMSTAASFSVYPWFTALLIFLHGLYHYFSTPKGGRYKMSSFFLAATSIMTPFTITEEERAAFGAIMLIEDWFMVLLWGSTVSGYAIPLALTVMGLDLLGRVIYSVHYRFQRDFITYLSEDTKITRKLHQIEEDL